MNLAELEMSVPLSISLTANTLSYHMRLDAILNTLSLLPLTMSLTGLGMRVSISINVHAMTLSYHM